MYNSLPVVGAQDVQPYRQEESSPLMQLQHRGENHFNEKVGGKADDDDDQRIDVDTGPSAFPFVFGIIKHLFPTDAAPVGTLGAGERVTARTGQFLWGQGFGLQG